jgi:hypothetical protein
MKTTLLALALTLASALSAAENPFTIRCGNLVYSMDEKTSVCFSHAFLAAAAEKTALPIQPTFERLRLGDEELFSTPFCVFTGTGTFKLGDTERQNFRNYLKRGGFIVASPGCSDKDWNKAFLREIETLFPDTPMATIPMTHPAFSTVHTLTKLNLNKSTGSTMLKGLEIDGRLALVFSEEGLNDVKNTEGCCCCGGNEISQSQQVNINLLIYALLY